MPINYGTHSLGKEKGPTVQPLLRDEYRKQLSVCAALIHSDYCNSVHELGCLQTAEIFPKAGESKSWNVQCLVMA